MQAPTVLLMNLKGRVVPDAGGRETQLDCNLLYNVTAGSALGVVSLGQDSLMSTTYTAPPSAAGDYMGSNGMVMQQQQGEALPGTINSFGTTQQQQDAMGTSMNSGMINGMGMAGVAVPGQRVVGDEQGQVAAKAMSGAAAAAASVKLVGASALAGLVMVLMLMV
ncbi:hypothetical protein COO60DRAFT_384683 [Scenedesmus sp. NREL 46B-D3]|nr:hypothetical protein COO60DRAFT_384683 [Scenedesmus sp. NREL 46B-D3]